MSRTPNRIARPPLALERTEAASAVAPPTRGRLLFVPDIVELLGGRKSEWWVRHRFAPATKIKIGRDCCWYESDAVLWLDAQRGKSA